MILVIFFVSTFHLCKDGLICIAPYKILFFGDSACGLAGIVSAFIQTAAIRSKSINTVAYCFMGLIALYTGYISIIHTNPIELKSVVLLAIILSIIIIILRYSIDRTIPPFRTRELIAGWIMAIIGLLLTKFQHSAHYPYLHSSWHVSAAISGYLIIKATLPAGCHPKFNSKWFNNNSNTKSHSNSNNKPSAKLV